MKWKLPIIIFCECLKVLVCIGSQSLWVFTIDQDLPSGVSIFNSCAVILGVAYCFVALRMILVKDANKRCGLLPVLTSLSSTGTILSVFSCVLMIYQKVAVIGR